MPKNIKATPQQSSLTEMWGKRSKSAVAVAKVEENDAKVEPKVEDNAMKVDMEEDTKSALLRLHGLHLLLTTRSHYTTCSGKLETEGDCSGCGR